MSGNGAWKGEMRLPFRDDEQLGAYADALRATLLKGPDPARTAELIPRLAVAARTSLVTEPPARPRHTGARRHTRLGLFARAGVAVALVPALFAGLAVAGVKLPDAVDAPFEAVGVDLPNQGSDARDERGSPASDGDAAKDGGGAGADPAGAPAKGDGTGKPADPGAHGRANAKEHGGQAHGPGGSDNGSSQSGTSKGSKGGNGVGPDGTPPGQTNPNGGGQGKGNAVGRTDTPPPVPPQKPVDPGKGTSGGGTDSGAAGGGGAAGPKNEK
jgi:hypothetical protein